MILKENIFLLLLNGAIGFVFIFILWFFSRGKIGLGDAKLSAFMAVVLGFMGWITAIFLASLTGLIFGLVLIKIGRIDKKERIPFGPFLASGAIISFLVKDFISSFINLSL